MNQAPVTAEQINEAIERLLLMALAHAVQSSASPVEQAKVRLALGHRSTAIQTVVDDGHALLIDALTAAFIDVLNGCVFGVED